MRLELVSLEAADRVELPGLLFAPDEGTDRVAVWLHGMGDNAVFYKPREINALAEALVAEGIALLAFNNRGAHGRKSLKLADETLPEEDRRIQGGMYYELIADCVPDIDGAATFLRQRGFSHLYLIGLSTGANKICVYHAKARQNPFSKYVLAGPGDDSGLFFTDLGAKKFWQALNYAAAALKTDPLKTMPKYTSMYPFSVRSAWDILNPDGDYNTFPYYEATHERLGKKPLFQEYKQLDKPTLVIFGDGDEYTEHAGGADTTLKLLAQHTSNAQLKQTDFVLVPDADHSFSGNQPAFAKKVADWLAS
ncbi:MAG TPA: alpha/beta hydrolase [Verrucomicrobiae bacterium]|nr:alpha/beta hydrolase [Verrucomicrobiae bacterium]